MVFGIRHACFQILVLSLSRCVVLGKLLLRFNFLICKQATSESYCEDQMRENIILRGYGVIRGMVLGTPKVLNK